MADPKGKRGDGEDSEAQQGYSRRRANLVQVRADYAIKQCQNNTRAAGRSVTNSREDIR